MKCPKCNVNLAMADRQGVEIDYCPECRGVWLDRGELDKIIERSSPNVQDQATRFDAQEKHFGVDERRYGHKKKKKGSFFEELFDF